MSLKALRLECRNAGKTPRGSAVFVGYNKLGRKVFSVLQPDGSFRWVIWDTRIDNIVTILEPYMHLSIERWVTQRQWRWLPERECVA